MQAQCGVEIGHLRPWEGQEKIARVLQQHRGVENPRYVFQGEAVTDAWWIRVSAVLIQAVVEERSISLQETKVNFRDGLCRMDALFLAYAGVKDIGVGAVRIPDLCNPCVLASLRKEQTRRTEIQARQLAPRSLHRLQ